MRLPTASPAASEPASSLKQAAAAAYVVQSPALAGAPVVQSPPQGPLGFEQARLDKDATLLPDKQRGRPGLDGHEDRLTESYGHYADLPPRLLRRHADRPDRRRTNNNAALKGGVIVQRLLVAGTRFEPVTFRL